MIFHSMPLRISFSNNRNHINQKSQHIMNRLYHPTYKIKPNDVIMDRINYFRPLIYLVEIECSNKNHTEQRGQRKENHLKLKHHRNRS